MHVRDFLVVCKNSVVGRVERSETRHDINRWISLRSIHPTRALTCSRQLLPALLYLLHTWRYSVENVWNIISSCHLANSCNIRARPIKGIFPVLCLLFLCCCGNQPKLSRLPPDAVILAFGDSLTHGNGAGAEESYPAVLERLSGRKVINAGVSGEESAQGAERLPGLLDTYQPQLLILCHGGNDILRKKDEGQMEANLRRMIEMARAKNIEVVLLGVPRPGLFLSSAEVYRRIAESTGVVFIEDLIPDVLGDRGLKSDEVHPNSKGYRVMAENIYKVLQDTGAL